MVDNESLSQSIDPSAREHILKIFRGDKSSTVLRPLLTGEQMKIAEGSEADFGRSVELVLERSPKTLFNAFDDFEAVLPKEKIREFLDIASEQNPFVFIQRFGRIKKYYDTEEQKSTFLKANEADTRHSALFLYFGDPAISQLFSKEEGREMLLTASRTVGYFAIEKDRIDDYVKEGFLTEEDVRGIVINLLQRDRDFFKEAGNFVTYFPDERREVLKKEVMSAYKKDKLLLFGLDSTNDILTDEDKRTIIRHYMQAEPDSMGFHLEHMEKLLPREEVQAWLKQALTRKYSSLFTSESASRVSLQGDMLSPEEKLTFRKIVVAEHPGMTFYNLEDYLTAYSLKERGAVLRQIIEGNPGAALGHISKWINYISADPAEQKAFIKDMLYEDGLSFVGRYNNESEENSIRTLFTRDEIKQLMYQQLELGAEDMFSTFEAVREFLGNDKETKEFVEKAREIDPSYFMSNIEDIMYLYTSDEIRNVVNELSQNPRSMGVCLSRIDEWVPILGKDHAWNLIQKLIVIDPQDVILRLDDCVRFVPKEKKEGFLMDLIKMNPPLALWDIHKFKTYFPDITEEKILALARSDSERLTYAPKTLASFYKDIARVKDSVNRQTLIRDTYQLYHDIAAVKFYGLESEFMKARSASELSAKREGELLSIFYC